MLEGHANSHQVVYETARSDLLGLEKLRLMTRHKVGKAFVFVASGRLRERLRRRPPRRRGRGGR